MHRISVPQHIAIIMDGNGRWARKRGLPRMVGHRRGVETVKKIVKASIRLGVRYLTLYAFSTENWLRPKREVKFLFKLLENFLDKELNLLHDNKIRLRVIGERYRLEERIRQKIEDIERSTADYDKLILNIALSYGSRQEILNAVRNISKDVRNGSLEPEDIDETVFSRYLYTRDCPDPDLLIRTSGEMRLSNFLLWQVSYTELYVVKKLWPDFNERDLRRAIEAYSKRERRFGR